MKKINQWIIENKNELDYLYDCYIAPNFDKDRMSFYYFCYRYK